MGSQERRTRQREQQRRNILDAALDIISKEGFAALSMRKLAERIEYSPASIYLYFESREQIAQELSERGFQELLDEMSAAVEGKLESAALHALGSAYVSFGLRRPELYRLIFMGDSDYMTAAYAKSTPDSAAARAYDLLLDLARQLIAAGTAKPRTELTILAETIWCTLHGIVSLRIACAASQSSSPEALASFATKTLARGINCVPATEEKKRKQSPAGRKKRSAANR